MRMIILNIEWWTFVFCCCFCSTINEWRNLSKCKHCWIKGEEGDLSQDSLHCLTIKVS